MKKIIGVCLLLNISLISSCSKFIDATKEKFDNSQNYYVIEQEPEEEIKKESKQSKKTLKIGCIYDERFVNSDQIYATQGNIYSVDTFGVDQYNKITYSSSKITDYSSNIVGITEDTVYYIENSTTAPSLYRLKDGEQSAEYLYDLSNDNKFFIHDKYIYAIGQNGSVIRHINSSEKYQDSAEVIYKSNFSNFTNASCYNECIYIFSLSQNKAVQISLKDDNIKTMEFQGNFQNINSFGASLDQNRIYFLNNKLIYVDSEQYLYLMNLDNGHSSKILDEKVSDFFYANKNVYIRDIKANFYYIESDMDTVESFLPSETLKKIFWNSGTINDIGDGLLYYTRGTNEYNLSDYDGNDMGIIKH